LTDVMIHNICPSSMTESCVDQAVDYRRLN